ncbi:MAG: hydantoinase/oxoprolinase family protein [Chloroflexi bacterium]|nr:hydantoinase/oxoprolinase family protein [Chloroflexota bacterium]
MRYMIGVDVGGTFTDLTLVDVAAQRVAIHKVLSTPADPSRAIMTGVTELLAREQVDFNLVDYFGHGTTVATNALIEKKGSKTGLLVTAGFKDLLEIGRQTRPALYDLQKEKPAPLVPGHLRKEIPERVYHNGDVRMPIDVNALKQSVAELRSAGVESIAICFLFSFVNPDHEKTALSVVRDLFPDAYVTASYQVVPEFREFARLSTTVLNAYLGPVMRRYLTNLQTSVRQVGIRQDPYITQSNGGILSLQESIASPVRTAVSGPSAGVMAATHVGHLVGLDNLITLDMGGTSADISLIHRGQPLLSMERTVEGLPVRIPMLDIVTIGAGGGSIAWLDAGGALKVGPQSAGANPGPACYGFGGTLPTVTDANVVLGRMNPQRILGGRMALKTENAESAILTHIAQPTRLSVLDAASGMIDVVNANMVRAMRLVSVERGYDPREFTMVAFGGAGPVHAIALAQELGIPRVLVPPAPGTLCSLGLLVTDIRVDFVRSLPLKPNPESLPKIVRIFDELVADGRRALDKENVPEAKRRLTRWIEARYQRQNFELPIPVQDQDLTQAGIAGLAEKFHAEHKRLYGYARPQAPVEFVNFRLTAVGELPKAPIPVCPPRNGNQPTPFGQREVFFEEAGGYAPTPLYQRDDLRAGDCLSGPAIIEQMDATTVLPPQMPLRVDEYGNLMIDVK